jgi:hypothetical protein
MKSTQKGNIYEREVKTVLESQGWLVEGQHRKVMYIRDKYTGQMKLIMAGRDVFGVDLIAKKLGEKTRWIQVSTVAQKSVKQKQVRVFPWTLEHESVELWLRIEGKRAFRVFIAVRSASQDPTLDFAEVETQSVPKEAKHEEDTEGSKRLTSQMASEYPE